MAVAKEERNNSLLGTISSRFTLYGVVDFFTVLFVVTIFDIFLQANNHDEWFDEQGVYVYKNKFLLILNHPSELKALQEAAVNIINLSAVSLNGNFTTIYNAFYTTSGREFQPVGRISARRVSMVDEIFANEKYHFNGRLLRISINYVSLTLFHLLAR